MREEGVTFYFGMPVDAIGREGRRMTLTSNGNVMKADHIISTMPLNVTAALCGIPKSSMIRSLTLLTLYVTFVGRMGFDCAILYNFSAVGAWKRLSVHSRAYGMVNGREYFSVEVPLTGNETDAERSFADFLAHVRSMDLFDGDAELIGFDVTVDAYPVYVKGASDASAELIALVEDAGVDLIGRQGRFDYLPTTTVATQDATRLTSAVVARMNARSTKG